MRFHRVLPRSHSSMKQISALTVSLAIIAVVFISGPRFSLGQEKTPAPDDWVKQVAPGIRLVGHANLSAVKLPSSFIRTWSPDGKFLVVAEGRRLLEFDWDQKQVTREVLLPIDPTRERLQSLLYSPDGQSRLLLIKETGQALANQDFYWDGNDDLPIEDDSPSTTGNRLLVYDSSWDLNQTWDLSDWIADHDYSADARATLSDNRTVLIHNNQSFIAFDYTQGKLRGVRSKNTWVYPISEHELLLSPNLEIWDLRDNSVHSPESIQFPKNHQVRAADPTGTKFLLQDMANQRTIMWDRKTKQSTPLLKDIGYVDGLFSTNGDLCFVTVTELANNKQSYHSKTLVYDISRQEVLHHSEFTTGPYRRSIRPAHHSLILESVNDPSIAEVKVDESFAESIDQALNRLPIRGPISFADNDRVVVFHGNHCFLTNDDEFKVIQHHAYNIDNSVYSPTTPQRIRIGSNSWHDIESGNWSEETFRVHYKVSPAAALFAMKSLFGVQSDSRPNIQAVHLGFDPEGQVIRDVYVENNETLRLRLSDSGSGKQISETRLYPEFDKSDHLKGTVSQDGKHVAIVTQKKLTILESKFGEVLREWDVVPQVETVLFDPLGEYVAIAAGKRSRHWVYEIHFDKILVYRVATGETVWSESRKGIKGFGFQPGTDRLYVLTSGDENQLRFFDRDTWQETWRHSTPHAPAYGMAMSSTGHEIAIGLRDSRVEFWKLNDIKKANSP